MTALARNFRERLALAIYARDFDAAAAELRLLEATKPEWAVAGQRARTLIAPPAPLPPCAVEELPAGAIASGLI